MQFTIDDSAIRDIERQLATVGKAFTPTVMNQILVRSAQPLKTAVQNEIPIGSRRRRGLGRLKRDGAGDGTYDRGGISRSQVRIWARPPRNDESGRILIGVSSQKGKVGWRQKFTLRGTKFQRANDYNTRAETAGLPLTLAIFGASCQTVVSRILTRFRS